MKPIKLFITSFVSLAIILSIVFTAYSFIKEVKRPQLPVLGKVNDFTLTDSNGEQFLGKKLRGKVWIVDFIFTTCASMCPIMSNNMAKLHRSFELSNKVDFVSISVNPEQDTPEVLARYAKSLDANTDQWHFLTGPRDRIKRIAVHSFKLGSIDDPVFHSSYFTLVDRSGLVRGYYDGRDNEAINKLFKDAAKLIKQR